MSAATETGARADAHGRAEPGLRTEWRRGPDALEGLEEAYRALLADVPHATPFNRWDWCRSAMRHLVPEGREPVVLLAWAGRRLVGCLPMTRGWEPLWGIPARTLRLLGHPLADRMALPVAADMPGALGTMLDEIAASTRSGADVAILSELPRFGGDADAARRWSAGRRPLDVRHVSRAPRLALSPDADPTAQGSNGLRKRLARARKRLEKAGELRFERHRPDANAVAPLIEAIAAVEDASWKGEQGTGVFRAGERRAFFTEVSRTLAADGLIEIALLYLDGELAGYRYGFRVGATYYDYNFAHRSELDALSIGRVLLDEVVRSAPSAGIEVIDASRGSLSRGNILRDWTPEHVDHDELWLFGTGPWGQVMSLLVRRAKPAAQRLKSYVEPMRWHAAS